MSRMNCITIDGPAGSGKSTVAKYTAVQLSDRTPITFEYLDTGSMYRSVALLGLRRKVDWNDSEALVDLAKYAKFEVVSGRTRLDGEDITDAVRSPEVTEQTRYAANNPAIREILVNLQRETAVRFHQQGKGIVTEGRDQGTVVFPDTPFKFFLTASSRVRALRRVGEMEGRGEPADFEEILQKIDHRDAEDAARMVGPLKKPVDALEIDTDQMRVDEVIEQIVRSVLSRINDHLPSL